MYTTITINGNEYKARLTAKSCVELERKLKCNPLNIFIDAGDGKLPTLEQLLITLHASLQTYHSNMKMDDMYELYDAYVDDGGNMMELINIILDIFRNSGFVDGNESKN